jgi:hypothetical protein
MTTAGFPAARSGERMKAVRDEAFIDLDDYMMLAAKRK